MSEQELGDSASYFAAFRDSHLSDYADAMREYRVGGNSGYPRFEGSDLVIQTMHDMIGALEETFADLSVPGGFATPAIRTRTFEGFLQLLEDRGSRFADIAARLVREGRASDGDDGGWSDHDYVPEPFHRINQIRLEVIEALRYTLQLESEPGPSVSRSSAEVIPVLLRGFHRYALQLRRRHDSRDTLTITDEYDVQDALHALLKVHFADVRAEEYTPSYAGGASRIDFLLEDDRVLIEVKMIRRNLRDRQVGEQVAIDMVRYRSHPRCGSVYFFVYDPDHLLANPAGLVRDLTRSIDGVAYRVVVAPIT